jgi:hypothetical protein
LTGNSDKGSDQEQGNSMDSKNHELENNKGENSKSNKSGSSPFSEIISNLKKLTMADNFNPEKSEDNPEKSEEKTSENPRISHINEYLNNSDKKDATSQKHDKSEDHAFRIPWLFGQDSITSMNNKKNKIVKGVAILIGGFLILYGLVLISASVTKVADNVIFGEQATLATFLMLVGVLIIVAAFAQRILDKTFLNKIQTELDVAEGRSDSDKSSKKVEDKNDNNVGKDNKDNIDRK